MGGSLGRKTNQVRKWATWYREKRNLQWLSVDEFIDAASREQGTHSWVTKTKLRKAAARLHRACRDADRSKRDVA